MERAVRQFGSAESSPCSITRVAIWMREQSPSLRRILETWVSTVRSLIAIFSAIRRLVSPCSMRTASSRSLRVSLASSGVPVGTLLGFLVF